jgi:hypothetical protein
MTRSITTDGKPDPNMPENFADLVGKAIPIIGIAGAGKSDQDVVTLMVEDGIPEKEAIEIILFLPLAFTQLILSEVEWSVYYFESYTERGQTKMKATENPRLMTMYKVILQYCKGVPDRSCIGAIAWRNFMFRLLTTQLDKNKNIQHFTVPHIRRRLSDPYSPIFSV